jgi:uncharacterized protein
MTTFDFESAKAYAIKKLERRLSPNLFYHSLEHTKNDVVPAVHWLAENENVSEYECLILSTAAWFHDLGYTVGMDDHESNSIIIAKKVLPDFGYSVAEIEMIAGIIEATRVPQQPKTHLEEIMADADLDTLGRIDFFETSHLLYVEMLSLGNIISPSEWIERQYKFLRSHTYFTETSKTMREPVKQENIAALEALLD